MLDFDRITFDPDVMGGRACIRGMRITVSLIVNLVANGMSVEEIIEAYPYLEPDDIQQALQYVAWLAEESVYTYALFPSGRVNSREAAWVSSDRTPVYDRGFSALQAPHAVGGIVTARPGLPTTGASLLVLPVLSHRLV